MPDFAEFTDSVHFIHVLTGIMYLSLTSGAWLMGSRKRPVLDQTAKGGIRLGKRRLKSGGLLVLVGSVSLLIMSVQNRGYIGNVRAEYDATATTLKSKVGELQATIATKFTSCVCKD